VRRGLAATALLLTLACLLAVAATAEAGFRVSPTTLDLERRPGTAASGSFDVAIKGERQSQFEVEVQDIVQQPDGSPSFVPASKSPYSASSWVSVSPKSFSGSPDRTQPVTFKVRVPADTQPGDHLTSLTVKRIPKADSDAIATSIAAISVRLTVHVVGRRRPEAKIVSFDAPSVSAGSLGVSATVENTGNVSLDFDGDEAGALSVLQGDDVKREEPFTGALFPGQTRSFTLDWDGAPLAGLLKAEVSVDPGDGAITDEKTVLRFPWKPIIALVLVALAAMVLLKGRRSGRI